MGRQSQLDLVVSYVNIRVMIQRFSELGDLINEVDTMNEIFEDENSRNLLASKMPSPSR